MERFVLNALRASLLPADAKGRLERDYVAEFARLRDAHLPGAVG
jgi:hypothetical protein